MLSIIMESLQFTCHKLADSQVTGRPSIVIVGHAVSSFAGASYGHFLVSYERKRASSSWSVMSASLVDVNKRFVKLKTNTDQSR